MIKSSLELIHIDYFREKGSILFTDLLSKELFNKAKQALCFIPKKSERNCWKNYDVLKKLSMNHNFTSIASALCRQKSLRLGFDHYFSSFHELKDFFKENPLSQKCSIDGLEIALLINLSASEVEITKESLTFPLTSGSACFFNPKNPLTLPEIPLTEGPFFLITYCKQNARYIYQALDVYTHEEKKEGQAFGDLISSRLHPLLSY
jgi:hypothetical protein